jgi:hypothetical protein
MFGGYTIIIECLHTLLIPNEQRNLVVRVATYIGAIIILANPAFGQSAAEGETQDSISPSNWIRSYFVNSAALSVLGGELLSSSGLSWPDGRQAVVTFWFIDSHGFEPWEHFRCIDYFKQDMQATGGACYSAKMK